MRVDQLILYIDVFLLTFAIGINAYRVSAWYDAPQSAEEAEEFERDNIGRGS